jgi:hypothetical protein
VLARPLPSEHGEGHITGSGVVAQTVEAVRVELGVGWNAVMRTVRDDGQPLVKDPVGINASTP